MNVKQIDSLISKKFINMPVSKYKTYSGLQYEYLSLVTILFIIILFSCSNDIEIVEPVEPMVLLADLNLPEEPFD